MKRLLLMISLAILAVLVFAPASLAQEDPCPDPDFPRETPDGCQASNLPDVDSGGTNTIAESCDDQPDPAGCRWQLRGAEGVGGTASASPTASPTASATASSSASATASSSASATATASAETTELPETGGVAPLALAALALLVTGGLMTTFFLRRS